MEKNNSDLVNSNPDKYFNMFVEGEFKDTTIKNESHQIQRQ